MWPIPHAQRPSVNRSTQNPHYLTRTRHNINTMVRYLRQLVLQQMYLTCSAKRRHLKRRLLRHRLLAWRPRQVTHRASQNLNTRSLVSSAQSVSHIYVHGHFNINYLHDSSTTTLYSHSNNTTTSTAKGSYNSNPGLFMHCSSGGTPGSMENWNRSGSALRDKNNEHQSSLRGKVLILWPVWINLIVIVASVPWNMQQVPVQWKLIPNTYSAWMALFSIRVRLFVFLTYRFSPGLTFNISRESCQHSRIILSIDSLPQYDFDCISLFNI